MTDFMDFLETCELDHNDTAAGLLSTSIRNLLVGIDASELPRELEKKHLDLEIEAPEPEEWNRTKSPEPRGSCYVTFGK
jgi:hypothetical protein